MRQSVAKLPVSNGGIGLPCVRTELMILATTTVGQWMYSATERRRRVVTTAGWTNEHEYVQPLEGAKDCPEARYRTTLWAIGREALRSIHGDRLTFDEQTMVSDGARTQLRSGENLWRWHDAGMKRDYGAFYRTTGRDILRTREEVRGRCNARWIPLIELAPRTSPLISADGTRLTTDHLRSLGKGTRVQDFVVWQWTTPFTLRFEPVSASFPLSNVQATNFRDLCNVLVANYPALLQRPDPAGMHRVYNLPGDSGHEWYLCEETSTVEHRVYGMPACAKKVSTTRDLMITDAVMVDGMLVRPQLEHAPPLSRLVAVWSGLKPWRSSRRSYARALRTKMAAHGDEELKACAERWVENAPTIGEALSTIAWKNLRKAPGMHARTGELWHRVCLFQLRSWSTSEGSDGCTRSGCDLRRGAHTAHIVWQCPRAHQVWRQVASEWEAHTGLTSAFTRAVFSWTPPPSSIDWVALMADSDPDSALDPVLHERLQYWKALAWRQLTSSVIHHLWSRRIAETHEPTDDPTTADWPMVLGRWRHQLLSTAAHISGLRSNTREIDRRIQRCICRRFLSTDVELRSLPLSSTTRYTLFFDGGSRGNPGPGGSGSVLVKTDPGTSEPQIVWIAAMSYAARTTTNNWAEYRGLQVGLQAAKHHKWSPIYLVGDSKLILDQLRHRRAPKAAALHELYRQALRLADSLVIAGWHHHYRDYNKMADKAANLAMDTKASMQISGDDDRPLTRAVRPFLESDMHQWARSTAADMET